MTERLIGQMIGAILAVYLFARLLEYFGVARHDPRALRVAKTTIMVSVAGCILYLAVGSGRSLVIPIGYLIGGLVLTPIRIWAAKRAEPKQDFPPDIFR